jgi:hypothetical protein
MKRQRLSKAYAIARSIQSAVAGALRRNLIAGVSGDGGEFASAWHDSAVFPGGGKSDRAGEPLLIDSGRLLNSVRPGRIVRNGTKLTCYIQGRRYGLDHHRGFVERPPVVIGRLRWQREAIRAGRFTGIPRGDTVVLKGMATVPARPWISIDRETAAGIVRTASQGV